MKKRNAGSITQWVSLWIMLMAPGTARPDSYGTGFFISTDGYLVTNHHVVKDGDEYSVFYKEKWIEAEVIRKDPANDLVILKAKGAGFPALAVDFTGDVRPGDSAFTIGFPAPEIMGFSPKTTKGAISSLSGIKDDPRFYQTTVAIQPGNSGGPLCDSSGNVIGITTSTLKFLNGKYAPQNVNYGLKSSYLRPLIQSIPGGMPQLAALADLTDSREVQAHVEKSVASVKATRSAPPVSPPPGDTLKIPEQSKLDPGRTRSSTRYMIVNYGGSEGINIRDSRNTNTNGNLHGALFQQRTYPLVQIGNTVTENSKEWVPLKVTGWVRIRNSRTVFLDNLGNGNWKVRKTSDGFVAMRTGTSTDHRLVCKLAFATVVREIDRDFQSNTAQYILAEFTGWAVKRGRVKEYIRSYSP